MKSGSRRQMLTGVTSRTAFASAMTESLTVANEEINDVCATIRPIGDTVLPLKTCRLYEQLGSPRSFGCFVELICAYKLNHRLSHILLALSLSE